MQIKSTIKTTRHGPFDVVYEDLDSTESLKNKVIQGVHAYCFYQDRLVVVHDKDKDKWTPPGGGTEAGETIEQTVTREVLEESNMRVLKQQIIGYQTVFETDKQVIQTRSVCLVEPIGAFNGDPAGDIDRIELIDPADYKNYFDWGEIGEHVMQRALELKQNM